MSYSLTGPHLAGSWSYIPLLNALLSKAPHSLSHALRPLTNQNTGHFVLKALHKGDNICVLMVTMVTDWSKSCCP